MSKSVGVLPPPPGIVANLNDPKDVLRTVSFVVQGMCLIITTIFVLMRMYTRVVIKKIMFKEDWVCLAAWVVYLAYIAQNILCRLPSFTLWVYGTLGSYAAWHVVCFFGGGYNVWEVTADQVKDYLKVNYAGLLLYGPTSCLIKLSLILFSARLFSAAHQSIIAIKILIGVMLGYYIPMQFARIFICSPIVAYWDRAPYPHSTCLDMRAMYLADAVMSSATDLAILIMPVPLVWTAKFSRRKKFRVAGILAAGGLATVASLARLAFVREIWTTHNGTLDGAAFNLLGAAENSIGLICACLPSYSVFLTHFAGDKSKNLNSSQPNIELGNSGFETTILSKPEDLSFGTVRV